MKEIKIFLIPSNPNSASATTIRCRHLWFTPTQTLITCTHIYEHTPTYTNIIPLYYPRNSATPFLRPHHCLMPRQNFHLWPLQLITNVTTSQSESLASHPLRTLYLPLRARGWVATSQFHRSLSNPSAMIPPQPSRSQPAFFLSIVDSTPSSQWWQNASAPSSTDKRLSHCLYAKNAAAPAFNH